MRLLHINVTCSGGSTGGIINTINEYLKCAEPDVQTFVAFAVGDNRENSFKFITCPEFFVMRALRKLFGKSLAGLYFPTKRLIKYIKKINPDIIHLHTIHHQTLNYKMLFEFLKGYKGKILYTLHDCWPFTGGCYLYSEADCDRFLSGCKECSQGTDEIDCKKCAVAKEFLYKKESLEALPITFVGVSNWVAGEAKKSFLKNKEITTIHNGIDADTFKPIKIGGKEGFTAISVANYWDKRKHLDILLKMAEEFSDVKFLVVGEVSESLDKSAYKNVVFCGKTKTKEELVRLYNSADVFLNFSKEETFGLVTVEAMACGLPIIAFNKTACAEIVSDACGLKAEDEEEFKKALTAVKSGKFVADKEKIRAEVLNNYTSDVMAQKYRSLYLEKFFKE